MFARIAAWKVLLVTCRLHSYILLHLYYALLESYEQLRKLSEANIFVLFTLLGNTKVMNQKKLEYFREELQTRLSSSYNVLLKERKLPMSLLNDHQKV